MRTIIKYGLATVLAGFSLTSYAVPVLQVGAYAGVGDAGTYADYQVSLVNPTESDTAVTTDSTILFAGAYGPNTVSLGAATNYGSIDPVLSVFEGHGAIVVASVQDGMLASALASLTIGGNAAFYASATLNGLFPNNHDPLKDAVSDFLFFDIGAFTNTVLVPDFTTESLGSQLGEIKALSIGGVGNLDWIHFDLMALEVTANGPNLRTTWEVNPGSHDVTWKKPVSVPEPSVLLLLGLGLLGLGFCCRKASHS